MFCMQEFIYLIFKKKKKKKKKFLGFSHFCYFFLDEILLLPRVTMIVTLYINTALTTENYQNSST